MATDVQRVAIDGPRLMQRVSVHVELKRWRQVRFRLWLMIQIMRFAAFVGGVGIEFDDEGEDETGRSRVGGGDGGWG